MRTVLHVEDAVAGSTQVEGTIVGPLGAGPAIVATPVAPGLIPKLAVPDWSVLPASTESVPPVVMPTEPPVVLSHGSGGPTLPTAKVPASSEAAGANRDKAARKNTRTAVVEILACDNSSFCMIRVHIDWLLSRGLSARGAARLPGQPARSARSLHLVDASLRIHGLLPSAKSVRGIMKRSSPQARRPSRPGDAGPASALFRDEDSPAALFLVQSTHPAAPRVLPGRAGSSHSVSIRKSRGRGRGQTRIAAGTNLSICRARAPFFSTRSHDRQTRRQRQQAAPASRARALLAR